MDFLFQIDLSGTKTPSASIKPEAFAAAGRQTEGSDHSTRSFP
jgi:hypothetical protein